MRYSITIDNIRANEWSLSIQEAYLFSWIYSLPSWAEKSTINSEDYFFASRTKVIEELPLLTDKPDTVYRYYKKLEEKGLIQTQKIGVCDYISLTKKGKLWNSVAQSEYSENNPTKLGKLSEYSSENNPTYKDINNNKINNIINIPFKVFWNLYNKKKDTLKCEKKWRSLSSKDRELIIEDVPKYLKTFSDKQYQKFPMTYLNGNCWLDEREPDLKTNAEPVKRFTLNDKYK